MYFQVKFMSIVIELVLNYSIYLPNYSVIETFNLVEP
jgi:hypothetical protein